MSAAHLAVIHDPDEGAVGAAWTDGGGERGLLSAGGASDAASAEVAAEEHGVGVRIGAGAASVLGTLRPATEQLELAGANRPLEGLRATPGTGRFTLSADTSTTELAARGALCTWEPPEPGTRLRLVALVRADGALLIAAAAGPEGGETTDERASAWGISPNGHVNPFSSALLSTEYDAQGRHTRIGMELWPDDDEDGGMPLRAAATLLPGAYDDGPPAAALMRGSAEGRELAGVYLLAGARPAAGG